MTVPCAGPAGARRAHPLRGTSSYRGDGQVGPSPCECPPPGRGANTTSHISMYRTTAVSVAVDTGKFYSQFWAEWSVEIKARWVMHSW